MIKKIFTIALLGGALALAGCASTTSVTPPATGNAIPSSDATVAQVQDLAAKACGFVPTVFTVTGIIAQFISGGAPVNALVQNVANSICAAVVPKNTAARRLSVAKPVVAGVPVEGYFLRQ